MQVKTTIKGITPILCNRFTDAAAMSVPGGKANGAKLVISGDKGTPRDQAEPKLYMDDKERPCIPGPNIFACIIEAGKFHKVGKSKLTTQKSSLIPGGVTVNDILCKIKSRKPWEVDSRSGVIPSTGGRVMIHRPRFDEWETTFTLDVDTEMFDTNLVRQLVDDAGKRIGLGDFRPARKGPFGRFVVTKWNEKK
jgi:hypothetical protein